MRRFGLPQLLMLSPAMTLLLAFITIPAVYVFFLSFTESTYGQAPVWIGLENYTHIWTDVYFWRSLGNTLRVVVTVVLAELVLALAVAYVLTHATLLRWLTIAVLLTPYAISEVVAVVMWKFMFNPDAGIAARSLEAAGLPALEWAINPTHGLALAAIISIWIHLPFTVVILYAAMLAIPKELHEAAAVDGAGEWRGFCHVILPLIVPAILIALIFRTIIAFRLFSEVWLLTAGGPARMTEVLAIYLYKQAFTYAEFGTGAAAAWVMVLVSGAFAALYIWQLRRQALRQG